MNHQLVPGLLKPPYSHATRQKPRTLCVDIRASADAVVLSAGLDARCSATTLLCLKTAELPTGKVATGGVEWPGNVPCASLLLSLPT